jgi:hypothetical protein
MDLVDHFGQIPVHHLDTHRFTLVRHAQRFTWS